MIFRKAKKNKIILIIISLTIVFAAGVFLHKNLTEGTKYNIFVPSLPKRAKKTKLTRYQRFKKFWHRMYKDLRGKKLRYVIKPLYNDRINKIETYNLTLVSYDGRLKTEGVFCRSL